MILHREIGGFSAGQKSKLTLGAAFWTFLGTKTTAIFGRSEFDMLEMLGWGWVGCVAWRNQPLFFHCVMVERKPHIIALDEPTNYIDMETLDALVQGLARYKGGIIVARWQETAGFGRITSKVWVCLCVIVVYANYIVYYICILYIWYIWYICIRIEKLISARCFSL